MSEMSEKFPSHFTRAQGAIFVLPIEMEYKLTCVLVSLYHNLQCDSIL